MFKKIVLEGPQAIAKFRRGIEVVDKIVGNTLGPGGRNRIIQEKYRSPLVINDGANIARRIVLDDPIEDMAAQIIIEAAMKTADSAGDGTTSATVMACQIVRDGYDALEKNSEKSDLDFSRDENAVSPMQLKRNIESERDKALELLKERTMELTDDGLYNVVSTSLEKLEYTDTLVDLLRKVGKEGYISVEDNWATKKEITTELTTGMKFNGKYASVYLATDQNRKEAVWEDTLVLVTNHELETTGPIKRLVDEMNASGKRRLVIIGGYSEGPSGFGQKFIAQISNAILLGLKNPNSDVLQVLAVKAPSLTSEELEDVALFCGAKFINKTLEHKLEDTKLSDLGSAKRIVAGESEVNIMDGGGVAVAERIELLKEQVENSKDVMFQEKLKRRVASLASGQGVIKVGAPTDTERSYLKEKLMDAVSAAKAAMAEGVVKGGGMVLREIAEELGKDSILYNTLRAPSERIALNAGWSEVRIDDTILDPAKVVRLSLTNACSGAGYLITADGALAEEKLNFMDYLEKALRKAMPQDERNDWRDDENQDLGKPGYQN